MLTFIGNGSAFNTELGNNSAYYKEGDEMLLIDCGSNIFERIINHRLLGGVNHIHVVVTHTHADHVGSLADLILFMYYSHGELATPKVTVYCCEGVGVPQLLSMNGVNTWLNGDHYYCRMVDSASGFHLFNSLLCEFVETPHVEEIPSTGLFLTKGEHTIYYSGDTYEIPEEVLAKFGSLHLLYIDTCKADYEGNVHLSLRKLAETIPPEYRHKVWCMHLDSNELRKEATELGFMVTCNLDTHITGYTCQSGVRHLELKLPTYFSMKPDALFSYSVLIPKPYISDPPIDPVGTRVVYEDKSYKGL